VNIWESEYDRIVVSEDKITCTWLEGNIAVIEVPREWLEGRPSRSESRQRETNRVMVPLREPTTA